MNKKPKVNIGIEIEVNATSGLAVDRSMWALDSEHCGYELRSIPCKSPWQIRKLLKTIEQMGKNAFGTTFENTGTHIHIDFLNDANNASPSDLTRLEVPIAEDGTWTNPLGTGGRYIWVCPSGTLWQSPKSYQIGKNGVVKLASKSYVASGKFVESVKRFMLIGVRFADVLFAMQHPSRRFNKYCHTISGWDEDILMSCRTVHEICSSPKLLQGHRRHMFNPLSFKKFGTVEVRMIKGMLDHKEIWEQIFLFGKIAQLAKSNDYIPASTGNGLIQDFMLLMGACKIHGKMRRRLTELFTRHSNADKKQWTARCFSCETKNPCSTFYDHGLSRPYCTHCHSTYSSCVFCGYNQHRGDGCRLDDKMEDGRYLCTSCNSMAVKKKIKGIEKSGSLYLGGLVVGNGTDNHGPLALRRMRGIFK